MEKQYSKAYNPIGQEGCYFTSLGSIVEKVTGEFIRPRDVNTVYAESVHNGSLGPNCYVQNPEKILLSYLEILGDTKYDLTYIGWWNQDSGSEFWNQWTSDDIDYEILRFKTRWGYHFTTPEYDPYPELERDPDVTGRRYFNLKEL